MSRNAAPAWFCRLPLARLLLVLLAALAVATTWLLITWQQEVGRVQAQLERLGHAYVPQLQESLRRDGLEATEAILKKMLESPEVMFVEIRPDRKRSLAGSGAAHDRGVIVRRFALQPATPDEAPSAGTALHVAISLSGVHQRMKDRLRTVFHAPGLASLAVILVAAAWHCRRRAAGRDE